MNNQDDNLQRQADRLTDAFHRLVALSNRTTDAGALNVLVKSLAWEARKLHQLGEQSPTSTCRVSANPSESLEALHLRLYGNARSQDIPDFIPPDWT